MKLTIIPLNKGFLLVNGTNAEAADISGLQERITQATHQLLGKVGEIKEASVIIVEIVPLAEANIVKSDENPFVNLFGPPNSGTGFVIASTKSQPSRLDTETKSSNSGGNNSDKPIRR